MKNFVQKFENSFKEFSSHKNFSKIFDVCEEEYGKINQRKNERRLIIK